MDLGLEGHNLALGGGAKIWGKIVYVVVLMARIIFVMKIWASGIRIIASLINSKGAKEYIKILK